MENAIEEILTLMTEMSKGQMRKEDDNRMAQESARLKEPGADGSFRQRNKRRREERQEDVDKNKEEEKIDEEPMKNHEKDDGRKKERLGTQALKGGAEARRTELKELQMKGVVPK